MQTRPKLLFFSLLCFFSPLHAVDRLDENDPKWAWMDEQIEEQFAPFSRSGITQEMLDETMRRAPDFASFLVRLKIINGKVCGTEQNIVLRMAVFARKVLERVASVYSIPDVDVIFYPADQIWQDWRLASPVLASCTRKNGSPKVIQMPIQRFVFFEDKNVPLIQKISMTIPWEEKVSKMFWRGQPEDNRYQKSKNWSTLPRGRLCLWSKQYPDLIDAAFSSCQLFHINGVKDYFLETFPLNKASWEEYLHHKYLIDLDGRVAAVPACQWKLLSNCAVFKHDSNYSLWFYKILEPWVHYIPLEHDLSDLFEKLQWALDHDAEVHQIAEKGRTLALENFMPEHMYLYCYKVLCKYASLQQFTPVE